MTLDLLREMQSAGRHRADVDDHPVHLNQPDHWVVGHHAGKRPFGIKRHDLQEITDRFGLRLACARGDAESFVDVGHFHVRLPCVVVEEVDPPDRPHDTAGPRGRRAVHQRRKPLSSEQSGESSACSKVFVVQMLPAERFDQIHHGVMLLPHFRRNCLTAA